MKKIHTFSLLLFAAFFVFSCNTNSDDDIGTDISIQMVEHYDSLNRSLILKCRTTATYPCDNFYLDHTVTNNPGNIEIDFTDVVEPEICLTAIGPARVQIDLGDLPDGSYNLALRNGDKLSSASLTVSPSSFLVQMNSRNGTDFTSTQLHKLPANVIWGLVGYHVSRNAGLAQSVIDSLQARGAQTANLAAGHYTPFDIANDGSVNLPGNHGYYYAKAFALTYDQDLRNIEDVVRWFAANHGNDLSIRVLDAKGHYFYSWTY